MRLLQNICLIVLLSLTFTVFARDEISSLNVDIQIRKDGVVDVREIYIIEIGESWFEFPFVRELPRYFIMADGFPNEANYKVLSAVLDNQYIKYSTAVNDESFFINIGDQSNEVVPGRYRLIVEYSLPNIVQYSSNYDFLDWQALTNKVDLPINKTKVRVHLPKQASLITQSGRLMLNTEHARSVKFRRFSAGKYYTIIKETLNDKDYVNFRVGWPKGIVKEPSFNQKTLRYILRYPIYFVYTFLLLIYVVSFIYLFAFSARKDVLKIFQRFSPATLFAFDYGEFNYKCILLALIRMAGTGAIVIMHQSGRYLLSLNSPIRLEGLERYLYEILERNSKGQYVQMNEIELDDKDWRELAQYSAMELNLPKAEYQKYFFMLTFSLSLAVLLHTFGRYDILFCLAMIYILFVIPVTLQYYSMKHIPFELATGEKKIATNRYWVYGLHFVMTFLLLGVSLDELDYFLFRAPGKDYEIFKVIGLLNYANVILYALQIHRYLVQIKSRSSEFKAYFIDPFENKLKENNRLYNAERLFSHYLPYAMIYNAEKTLAEYCSHTFVRAGGERYQIKWFKLDGDFEGSFEGIARFLSRDFMLNVRGELTDDLDKD